MEFRELLRKTVSRLFFVVWPPWGEEKESDIDISFGFVFNNEPSKLYVISVDKDELWVPHIFQQPLPDNEYAWGDFYDRMKLWMEAGENTDLVMETEYYNVSQSGLFEKIVESEIIGIELIEIEDYDEPFGVKLLFKDDYILSIPNSDGNTVETKFFNKNNSIGNFKRLGNVNYSKV